MVLRGRDAKGAVIRVKATGPRQPSLALPLAAPVTVQLVDLESGACWGRRFEAGDVRTSDEVRFRAKTTS
jgi:hypothetical protein